jgi:hypothetical protein
MSVTNRLPLCFPACHACFPFRPQSIPTAGAELPPATVQKADRQMWSNQNRQTPLLYRARSRRPLCRLQIGAHRRMFEVILDREIIKIIPIKGLFKDRLDFEDYLTLMVQEAD